MLVPLHVHACLLMSRVGGIPDNSAGVPLAGHEAHDARESECHMGNLCVSAPLDFVCSLAVMDRLSSRVSIQVKPSLLSQMQRIIIRAPR